MIFSSGAELGGVIMVCVGFRKSWAVTYIVVAAAGLAVVWPLDVWWQTFVTGAAVAMLVTGIFRLFRPYFEFDPGARMISIATMPGAKPLRYGGAVGSGMLHVSGHRIVYIKSDGRPRRVPVVRFMAEPIAWNAVVGALSQPRGFSAGTRRSAS